MKLAVLVPVLNRPGNVAPLVESFAESDTPGSLFFVVQRSDHAELDAIRDAGASHLLVADTITTWPQKINHAVRNIHADWYLFGADDVRFHHHWWHATRQARRQYKVIGTNDLRNERVIAGDHATHPLVEGRYARDVPMVDGRRGPLHEGYRHWFVDDEFVTTAKIRGVWTSCPSAVVEHFHPYWNDEVDKDLTYILGEANAAADRREFQIRSVMLRNLAEAVGA